MPGDGQIGGHHSCTVDFTITDPTSRKLGAWHGVDDHAKLESSKVTVTFPKEIDLTPLMKGNKVTVDLTDGTVVEIHWD